MSQELHWFQVKLELSGMIEEDIPQIIEDIQEELNMRDHLRNDQLIWNTATKNLHVSIELEGLEKQRTADNMAEELLEVSSVIVPRYERIHIEILDVQRI